MRLPKFAIGVAAIVVATGVAPAPRAGASVSTTLYVGTGASCSDTGSGTSTAPFCTVTAALAAVQPGQTVMVSGAHDEAVVVNRSGTTDAPITFSGSGSISGADAGVTLDGVHDVVWSVGVSQAPSGLVVRDSTRITVRSVQVFMPTTATVPAISLIGTTDSTLTNVHGRGPAGAILLDAATSGVSVISAGYSPQPASPSTVEIDVFGSRDKILNSGITSLTAGAFVRIEPGATDNIVADNQIGAGFSDGIDDNGAGTDIVNNTIGTFCDVGINVGPTATNTSVENNIVMATRVCSTDGAAEHVGIGVFGAATATATVDYNTVTTTAPNLPYAWTTDRDTLAAFRQASGQGAHDNTGSAQTVPAYASPNTDSANSAAPGYQPTDFNGKPRADNPIAANTGAGPTTYADRGAVETQPTAPTPVMHFAPQTLLTGDPSPSWQVSETVTVPGTWAPVTTISAQFGDGSPPVTQNATLDATGSATATFTHIFHGAGLWQISAGAVDSLGGTGSSWITTNLIGPQVVFAAGLSLTTTVAAGTPFTVQANPAAGSPGASTFTINFGDGTAPVAADASNQATHTYQKSGTYDITTTESAEGITYTSGPSTASVTNGPGRYTPVAPTRILDTRDAVGVGTRTPLAGGHTMSLAVAGVHGVPAAAIAVALNLTATQGTSSGFLTAYADGRSRPNASDLNWSTGATVPNFVVVPVVDGKINLYNGGAGSVHLVADLAGYYSLSGDDYTATAPSRVIDTRNGTGTAGAVPVQPGQTVKLDLSTAFPGVTGLDAATFNVTVTQPSKSGYLTVYPEGASRPTASNLNWVAGQTTANSATVANQNGTIDFYNNSSGTVHLVVDAFGYYRAGTSFAFATQDPNRVLDTRDGIGAPTTKALGPHQSITFDAGNTHDIDLFNVTVTGGTSSGYLSLAQAGSSPTTSNLNWAPGQTVANTALVSVGDPGQVTVYNGSGGTVHVIVDELGAFAPDVTH